MCSPDRLAPDRRRDGVLITRPAPGCAETASRVAGLGWRPVLAPMLHVVPTGAVLPEPQAVQAVLVSSAAALPCLPAAWHGVPLLAVGDATAAKARAAGFSDVRSAGRDAAALAALAKSSCDPAGLPLLLAGGADQAAGLAALLSAAGFAVSARIVYAAVPVPALPESAVAALERDRLRAVLFFSPATARTFVNLFTVTRLSPETLAQLDACAISGTTEEALATLPWRRIRVASAPNQDELLALIS